MSKKKLSNPFNMNSWGIKPQMFNIQTDYGAIIGMDAGGTKTLVGHLDTRTNNVHGKSGIRFNELSARQYYTSDQFNGLEEIIGEYIKANSILPQESTLCIAGAGPVQNNAILMSNRKWTIDADRTRKHFNFKRIYLLNDLAAMIYAIDFIDPRDITTLNQGQKIHHANAAVIAAGTGLGESMGIYIPGKNYRVAIAGEGGNADFSPGNATEIELYQYLQSQKEYVSWEDLLSGKGLKNIYEFLLQKNISVNSAAIPSVGNKSSEEISRDGVSGHDPTCRKTLEIFSEIYGAETGNMALRCLPWSGIYLMGGIAPAIAPILQSPGFLKRFVEKGRTKELLKSIPVYLVSNPEYGIIGAINYAIIQSTQI